MRGGWGILSFRRGKESEQAIVELSLKLGEISHDLLAVRPLVHSWRHHPLQKMKHPSRCRNGSRLAMPASAEKLVDCQAAEYLDHHGSDVEDVLCLQARKEVELRLPTE